MKKLVKIVERLTNTHIYRALPRGVDFVQDIANSFPKYHVDVVFDVGANVGQYAKVYLDKFPGSHIYCFEPVGDTFRQLQKSLGSNKRIDCYQLALGSSKCQGRMVLQNHSNLSYLLDPSKPMSNDMTIETVDIDTLDDFCHTKNIAHINYLKIDTEGGDLEVLKGAVNMLIELRIDLVHVEAGMNPDNDRHVPFNKLKEFLELHGYLLFAIYKQMNEWPTGEPQLRRTNPLFISQLLRHQR